MSDRIRRPEEMDGADSDKAPRGVNLYVIYGVMLIALLVAIGLATLIVLPFWHRR